MHMMINKIKKSILTLIVFSVWLDVFGQTNGVTDPVMLELLDMELAALGSLQVYTPSRELTSIEKAPSVVTVITARQIERQGLKSLHEVLARVPGFFNATSPFMEPISNRGFAQNVNTNYLLLLDGHALNNDAINGLGHMHMMPGLDHIARIEIVRGPGSTLWGANAAMGIIHLITKGAAELDKGDNAFGSLQMSADYEFDHQRQVIQGTYAKQFDQGSILIYGKVFNSDADWTTSYQVGATDLEVQSDRQMNLWDFEDSHDLNAKMEWNGWKFKAGDTLFENFNPIFTPVDGSTVSEWTSKKQWIELGRKDELSTHYSLEWKLFRNQYEDERLTKRSVVTTGIFTHQFNSIESEGNGGEAIVHFDNLKHHLLLGVSASNLDMRNTATQIYPSGFIEEFDPIPAITDKNRAIFFEESYRDIEDWIFTLGLRVDRNEPRGDGTYTLPRTAASYSINDRWSVKYAYNTGYVAPTHEQTRGGIHQPFPSAPNIIVKGAEDIQESRSHDLQLFYNDNRSSASLTLYHHTLTDIIQWSGFGPVTVNGIPDVTLFEVNASDMETWGLELEAKTELNDSMNLYGNYAFTNAEYQDRFVIFQGQVILDLLTGATVATEDGTITGTPRHIWNLGLDWSIRSDLTLNVHYRGWDDAWAKNSNQPSFKSYGPYHYLDINLRHENFLTKGLIASAYIKNMFDNNDAIPNGVTGGEVVPQNGRQLGLQMSYRF